MVVNSPNRRGQHRLSGAWRLAWWAFMAASVFWTALYLAGDRQGSLPGFTYVNF